MTDGDRVIQTCGCAWDRLFRARAELIVDGEMEPEDMHEVAMDWRLSGRQICPSARAAFGAVVLAYDEPRCGHDPYKGCECPPITDERRRSRVAELLARG